MFPTFSGSARRPRNVNLSGRKSHAFGSTGSAFGPQATVDRAQQERAQRQKERETKDAAEKIQRVWRGHASRQKLAVKLRQEWDARGEAAAHASQPYSSEQEALAQLHQLVRFSDTRNKDDVQRIRRYGLRLVATADALPNTCSGPWPWAYLRFQTLILTVMDRQASMPGSDWHLLGDFMTILHCLVVKAPHNTAAIAPKFYHTLARVLSQIYTTWQAERQVLAFGSESASAEKTGVQTQKERNCSVELAKSVFHTAVTPLTCLSDDEAVTVYQAFGRTVLPLPALCGDYTQFLRDYVAEHVDSRQLASALAQQFKTSSVYSQPELKDPSARLRLLGVFIYIHQSKRNLLSGKASFSHIDFVAIVSLLLNSLPVGLLDDQVSDTEQAEDMDSSRLRDEINSFLKGQLESLVNQESIGSLLSQSSSSSLSSEEEKAEEARQFANYALALLRFFPRRSDEIRMWLHIGPSTSADVSNSLPAIKFFWRAMKQSSVFDAILRDSRVAIKFLRPQADSSTLLGHNSQWHPPQQVLERTALIADKWRVILIFLELYTFILKVTDDEEFFSTSKDPFSDGVRENALPLSDVKDLTTFLKNLGFTLYFNAPEITATEEADSNSGGLSFFNPSKVMEPQPQREPSPPSVGGVTGLGLERIKGLVTGVLRMVYERDSRRKFLPANHWLMTSRFDMTGFIPAVVEEEESRHRIEEEDAEDMDEDEEYHDQDDEPQLIGTSRSQYQRRLAKLQRQQRKASRQRYLQSVAPRLEILQNMPFFIPFTTRVQIFREFVKLDMTKRRGSADPDMWRFRMMQRPDAGMQFDKHSAKIRREHEFEDAFEQFYPLGSGLKEPIQITFVDQFGAVEAGIDGGGVTKEFLTSVTDRAFLPSDGIEMFVTNDQHLLYPNPAAIEEHMEVLKRHGFAQNSPEFKAEIRKILHHYEFIGRIIGKCLYEGILVDINFAPFFLRKWALTGGFNSAPRESGYRPSLNDLRDLDEGLYQGLHQLKNYTGDVEDFALNFTVTDTVVVDHTTTPKKTKAATRELIPGGSDRPVTNQDRLIYISYMVRHRLSTQASAQTSAFLRGLSSMIEPSWLSMFNQSELQTLIGGSSSSIDIDDLRRNTAYGGTYVIGDDGLEHPTIQMFWQVMTEFSDGERRAVLKFVTSTPRAPLLGFGTLNPRFSIRDAGSDQDRLPSTSTCVNLLKLPMYQDKNVLKEKLRYSAFSGAGFDLS